ncbi:hypothetical protein ElyMa_001308700 [Elysia marginata]|uniref:Uncharacterized protein n=1 Tax=Elysia marginata TaxID=1093978 RepID=A0AAV4IM30_9GAST|nr:hypothetical protein ElyMa_001308700 [Elysia marginata]
MIEMKRRLMELNVVVGHFQRETVRMIINLVQVIRYIERAVIKTGGGPWYLTPTTNCNSPFVTCRLLYGVEMAASRLNHSSLTCLLCIDDPFVPPEAPTVV